LAKRNTKGSKNIQLVADMKTLKLSTSWFVKDPRELFDRCWQPPTATLDSQRTACLGRAVLEPKISNASLKRFSRYLSTKEGGFRVDISAHVDKHWYIDKQHL
jgi:hypothetical protein